MRGREFMKKKIVENVSKNQLRRFPVYLSYLKGIKIEGITSISAPNIAQALGFNEVQVRKDIAIVSKTEGKPKSGRDVQNLITDLESFLSYNDVTNAVIVGVGHLGRALLSYKVFTNYGLNILAGFDDNEEVIGKEYNNKKVFPMSKLTNLINRLQVHIGIIAVPEKHAQEVADKLIEAGIMAIWNFAPVHLNVPDNIIVQDENMASSLAILSRRLKGVIQ